MSVQLEQKFQELSEAVTAMRAANDKGISDTAETANKAITRIQGEIEGIKASLVESRVVADTTEKLEKATWKRGEKDAFKKWMRQGAPAISYANSPEALVTRATVGNETTGADGGYGIPIVIEQAVDLIIQETSPVEQLSTPVTIGTQTYTKLLDNNDASASWGSEITTSGTGLRTQTNVNTFTRVQISPQILYANPQLSLEMIEDVQFDAEAELIKALGDKLSRARNTGFVSGSGSGSQQPSGFNNTSVYSTTDVTNNNNAPVVGNINTVAAGTNGAVSSNDIHALIYNLRAGYRNNAKFAMHRLFLEIVRNLKDSYGRYMWQPSYMAGQPDTLAGYPVYEFDDLPSTISGSATTYPIVFADWQKFYRIVDRVGLQLLRDPYSVEGAVVYKTRQRVSGAIENGIAGVTLAITHA